MNDLIRSESAAMQSNDFPSLPLNDWRDTRDTLHGYARLLGKIRAALTPRQKHWWHITLRTTALGLTTTPILVSNFTFEMLLDLAKHRLVINTSNGESWSRDLTGQSLATLFDDTLTALAGMGISPQLDPSIFSDSQPRGYDTAAVARYWQATSQIDAEMKRFKGTLREQTSPVQLFPHHFDLSVNWFSGRLVPGVDPNDEENADEQMNFGFSTGDESIPNPYFYVTAYPWPDGLTDAPLPPDASWRDEAFVGAVMMYEALTKDETPNEKLFDFLSSTQQAGARLTAQR